MLAAAPGRKILVLGDLAELGPDSLELHGAVGAQAKAAGIDLLFTVGTSSEAASHQFGSGARHFAAQPALTDALRGLVASGDVVLCKGSRSARMELVLAALADEERIAC